MGWPYRWLVGIMLVAMPLSADITSGLVAHYTFDGNGDDSVGNADLLMPYGDVSFAPGRFGQAADFSASAAYFKSAEGALPQSNEVSYAFWINAATEINQSIIMQTVPENTTDHTHNSIDHDPDGFCIWGLNHTFPFARRCIDQSHIFDGTWRHVVITSTGTVSSAKVYVDGVHIENFTVQEGASDPFDLQSTLYVGTRSDAAGDPAHDQYAFRGLLDDLRIYNRALSAADVQSLYGDAMDISHYISTPGVTWVEYADSNVDACYIFDPDNQQVEFVHAFMGEPIVFPYSVLSGVLLIESGDGVEYGDQDVTVLDENTTDELLVFRQWYVPGGTEVEHSDYRLWRQEACPISIEADFGDLGPVLSTALLIDDEGTLRHPRRVALFEDKLFAISERAFFVATIPSSGDWSELEWRRLNAYHYTMELRDLVIKGDFLFLSMTRDDPDEGIFNMRVRSYSIANLLEEPVNYPPLDEWEQVYAESTTAHGAFTLDENWLLVAGGPADSLDLLDISDPYAMVHLADLDIPFHANLSEFALLAERSLIAVSDTSNESIALYDINNPETPYLHNTLSIASHSIINIGFVAPDRLAVEYSVYEGMDGTSSHLRVYDISYLDDITPVGNDLLVGAANTPGLTTYGEYVFIGRFDMLSHRYIVDQIVLGEGGAYKAASASVQLGGDDWPQTQQIEAGRVGTTHYVLAVTADGLYLYSTAHSGGDEPYAIAISPYNGRYYYNSYWPAVSLESDNAYAERMQINTTYETMEAFLAAFDASGELWLGADNLNSVVVRVDHGGYYDWTGVHGGDSVPVRLTMNADGSINLLVPELEAWGGGHHYLIHAFEGVGWSLSGGDGYAHTEPIATDSPASTVSVEAYADFWEETGAAPGSVTYTAFFFAQDLPDNKELMAMLVVEGYAESIDLGDPSSFVELTDELAAGTDWMEPLALPLLAGESYWMAVSYYSAPTLQDLRDELLNWAYDGPPAEGYWIGGKDAEFELFVGGETPVFTQLFRAGWNLSAVAYDRPLSEADLADKAAHIDTVWLWRSGQWHTWASDVSMQSVLEGMGYPRITQIEPGEGFWVLARSAFSAEYYEEGSYTLLAHPRLLEAGSGWHLLGTGETIAPGQIVSALSGGGGAITFSAPSDVTIIWGFQNGEWRVYSPDSATMSRFSGNGIAPLESIKKGEGLWLKLP